MAAPAIWLARFAVGEAAVKLLKSILGVFRRKPKPPTDPTATAPVTPHAQRYRPRPTVPLICLGALLLTGCAGPLADLEGDELMQFCRAVVPPPDPCEPCPPCPPPTVPPEGTTPPKPGTPPADPPKPPAEQDTLVNLWKPLSDSQPPRAFWITSAALDFGRCAVTTRGKKGKTTVCPERPPRANGNRQHWDCGKPGASFGKQVRVTCTGTSGTKTWTVPDGSQRWETR